MEKQRPVFATIALFTVVIMASFGLCGTAFAGEADAGSDAGPVACADEPAPQVDTQPNGAGAIADLPEADSPTALSDQADSAKQAASQGQGDPTAAKRADTPLENATTREVATGQDEAARGGAASENAIDSATGNPGGTAGLGARAEAKAGAQVEAQTEAQATFDGVYAIASAISNSARVGIEGASTQKGAETQVYGDNWSASQRWRISDLGDGYYKILNVASGKALDVAYAQAGDGARVQQYDWKGTDAQRWAIESVDGGYRLYSALSKKYVLDLAYGDTADGTRVQLYHNKDTKAQVWRLEKIEAAVPDGEYVLTSQVSGKALDVADASVSNAANVQQYQPNGTLGQKFRLTYDSSTGYYTVLGAPSGMALDVSWGLDVNGANVQMYTPNGSLGQKWAIAENDDGTFTFRSAVGGRALDVAWGSTANGANVQIYTWNSAKKAQKWTLSDQGAWDIPEGVYNIVSSLNTGNAVAVTGGRGNAANVATATSSAKAWSQKWVFAKADGGYYTVRNLDSLKMLDIANGAAANGTNVQQYRQNGKDWQLWKLELTPGGIVFRSKANPQYVLDIVDANANAGANVQMHGVNGSKAQMFRLRSVRAIDDNTTFTVKNISSGKALDIAGSSRANGAAAQLNDAGNAASQKFRAKSAGGNAYYLVNVNSQKCFDVSTSTRTKLQQWEGLSGKDKQWSMALDYKTGTFFIQSAFTGKYLDGTGGKLALQDKADADAQRFALTPTSTFKLFLNAGHGEGNRGGYDGGASGNGYEEAQLTSDLASRIIDVCNEYGIEVVDGRPYHLYYSERLNKAVQTGCSAILSLHFNSADGGASGYMSMVGTWGRHPDSELFNGIIHAGLAKGLSGLPDNGVSYRDDITCVNGNIPASLIEVCFIDNAADMAYYDSRRDYVARQIADSILEASTRPEFNK